MNNKKNNKLISIILSLIIGILIAIIPNFITGESYNPDKIMGNLLVADLILRVISPIIGLIVIYDGIKTFFK